MCISMIVLVELSKVVVEFVDKLLFRESEHISDVTDYIVHVKKINAVKTKIT